VTSMCCHMQLFSIDMGSRKRLCPGWPGAMIILISASQEAGITGMDDQGPCGSCVLYTGWSGGWERGHR
jgi:hypothetical protein